MHYRGDYLQPSRDRVSAQWNAWGYAAATSVANNIGFWGTAATGALMARNPGALKRARPSSNAVQDHGGYTQLQWLRRSRTGRRKSRNSVLLKALQAQLLTRIDRFQGLTSIKANSAYSLSYVNTNPNYYEFPFYLFDLTSLQGNLNGANTVRARPMMRLCRSANVASGFPVNAYFWVSYGTNPVNDKQWQIERLPYTATAANVPYEKAMLNWADIRMVVQGAANWPSRVDMQLVRFTDDQRAPSAFYDDSSVNAGNTELDLYPPPTGSTATDEYSEYTKFWTAHTDNLINNPLVVRGQVQDSKGMVVLHSKTFLFNPTMTTETDTLGHQKVFKHFHNMDSIYSYKIPITSAASDDIAVSLQADATRWPTYTGQTVSHVYPNKQSSRLFLLVKGFTPGASGVAADNPAFDLMIRRKMTII